MNRIATAVFAGVLAVICIACQPALPDATKPTAFVEPEIYTLQGGELIDRDGNPVDQSQDFNIIYEINSDRAQAKTLSRMEDTGERNEYGNPIVRHLTALYDLEGNLLCDWDEVSYESGFGDYVVRREVRQMDMMEEIKPGFLRGLWSLTEKKLVLPEAVMIEVYDDTSYLVSDNTSRFLGRIDRHLNPIGEFPLQDTYYNPSVWGEYIYVVQENPFAWYDSDKSKPQNLEILLTKDYQIALEKERISASFYQACSEKLAMCEEKGVQQIYSMPEKRVVREWGTDIWLNYFDDEVIILRKEKVDATGQNDRFISWLETIDGERLTEDYRMLEPVQDQALSMRNTPVKEFIGVRDNRIELLDHNGKVTKQVEIPNVVLVNCYGKIGFTYGVELKDKSGKTLTDEWGTPLAREGLLDKNLQIIIPAEKYQFIQPQYRRLAGGIEIIDLIAGTYTMPDNKTMRRDLLDSAGKVIAGQLTMVGEIGEDRVQVTKGFHEGLINFKGEWIYKQSLFRSLEDE